MEFRDIDYFTVLADHGHVGRAAEALGLSPPALSLSLKRLETAMQAKLFDRTPKGIELTATGTALLARAKHLRLVREDVLREAADLRLGRAGHLRIGAGPGLCIDLLPQACEAILKQAAGVTLTVTVGARAALVEAIRNGKMELAVIPLQSTPYEDLTQEPICNDAYVVYCSINHQLAKKKRVNLIDLAQEEWTIPQTGTPSVDRLYEVFREHKLPKPKIRIETGSHQIINHIIASTNLLGFSSIPVIRQVTPQYRYAELRVKELAHARHTGVVYRKGGYLSPAARRLIDILKNRAKEIAIGTGTVKMSF